MGLKGRSVLPPRAHANNGYVRHATCLERAHTYRHVHGEGSYVPPRDLSAVHVSPVSAGVPLMQAMLPIIIKHRRLTRLGVATGDLIKPKSVGYHVSDKKVFKLHEIIWVMSCQC